MSARNTARSPYIEWAKQRSSARHNLATSGMVSLSLAELEPYIEKLELTHFTAYGYVPLLQALARRYRVPQDCVVSATGTSMANYLALAAATEPGDEVLIEQPSYEPLLSVARYLGLEVRRFQRPADQDFAIDLADLERNLSSRTRVIVLCNLHNPSGAFVSDSVLQEIAGLARKSGSYVLVDEVYREMLFEAEPQSAFHIDPERFISTNSLTKAYGLSGLRCGWVLANPELARRMYHIDDLHGGTHVSIAEQLSVIALERLPEISARMKALLDQNRKLLREFLRSRQDLDYFWPDYGTIVFPRLRSGSVEELCTGLRRDFDITVAPGSFFECPDRFRMGVGTPTTAVRESLRQLSTALNAYEARVRGRVPVSRS